MLGFSLASGELRSYHARRGNVCSRTRSVRHIGLGGLSGLSEEGELPMPDPDCEICNGGGYVNCSICKGTGKDKKNGSILERWTCRTCKGFGYVGCVCIKKAGLTPEQRGTR